MDLIKEWLPYILEPKHLVVLIIAFVIIYWILNTLKFISSIILKVLIALAIVLLISYFLGINAMDYIG